MVSVNDIFLQFGGKTLLNGVSFRIGPRDRIGLVGSNGAGKTTLLRILLGEQEPDSGVIAKANYVTVGYLPQEGTPAAGRSLYEEAESVFGDILRIQRDLDEIHRAMEVADHTGEEFHELLTLSGELQHRLEDADVFRMKSNVETVLMGLGFAASDFSRSTDEFSGGWQMRIALAKLLLGQPSLLLLDEPTNHLDLDSLRWLEDYLEAYDGAVMIVSHDSRFLDTMTSKTYSLSLGGLTEYAGNYTFFLKERAERKELQVAAYENQQMRIRQTRRFIDRFRAKATKARQVQSRIKALEKLELIELEDEETEIRFAFPDAPPGGRSVIELRGIEKRYGDSMLFNGLDFDIERGDRVAFVGPNGAGKSTLSRVIAGVEPFDSGERKVGYNVMISYFAQHQAEELDPSKEVLRTLEDVASGETRVRLRTLLGSFLFRGDDVFKKVKVLSGGEKSRLALARMLVQPSNMIVLDEPTNHLDMRSKAVLLEALLEYQGSCVIVSHDRDFLDPLVTRVVEFRNGAIALHEGNISDYLDRRAAIDGEALSEAVMSRAPSRKEKKRIEAEERQERYRRIGPIRTKLESVETFIAELEKEKTALEARMSDPEMYRNGEEARAMTERYRVVQESLAKEYFRWNDLAKKLDEAESEERKGQGG